MPESATIPQGTKLSEQQKKQLDLGYEFVEVPEFDLYDYKFEGFWINGLHLKPGKHLLAPDWAAEAKRILKVWETGNRRMLRPTPHRESERQVDMRSASPTESREVPSS